MFPVRVLSLISSLVLFYLIIILLYILYFFFSNFLFTLRYYKRPIFCLKVLKVNVKICSGKQILGKVWIKINGCVHLFIDKSNVLHRVPWSVVTNIIVTPSSSEELRAEGNSTTQIFRVRPNHLQEIYRWDKQTVLIVWDP